MTRKFESKAWWNEYWYSEMLKQELRNVNELKTYFKKSYWFDWKCYEVGNSIERALKWRKKIRIISRCEETKLWRFVENMKKNWNNSKD